EDVEILTEIEFQNSQGATQSAEDLTTQHGTVVINHVENDRALAEVFAQGDVLAGFIFELQIERQLRVEILRDADVLQHGRTLTWGRRHHRRLTHLGERG